MALLNGYIQSRLIRTVIIELEDVIRLVEGIGAQYDPEGSLASWLSSDEVVSDVEQVLSVSFGLELPESLEEELIPYTDLITNRKLHNLYRLLGGRSVLSVTLYDRYGGLSIVLSER